MYPSRSNWRSLLWILLTLAGVGAEGWSHAASANCNDQIAQFERVRPSMERQWQQLQQQGEFSWGREQPYGRLDAEAIYLTPAFNTLSGPEKRQALAALYLDYSRWYDMLTPEEQQALVGQEGLGAISPYRVYASDGRLVSAPYDGCTRFTLLTERDRYRFYYSTLLDRANSVRNPEALRNGDRPFWRVVNHSIPATTEQTIRLQFWDAVGYDMAREGWWIAWVPEQGQFELVMNPESDRRRLERFWRIAPQNYTYVVLTSDGTFQESRY